MPAVGTPHDDPVIIAAGGIISRETPHGDEVMVIRRNRHADWTFPKGKLKPGESLKRAAIREVLEETGCKVRLGMFLGAISYEVNGAPKIVLYWRLAGLKPRGVAEQGEI